MQQEETIHHIHRFLAGELVPNEHELFVRRIAAEPAFEQEVQESREVWAAAGLYKVPEFDSAKAMNRLSLDDQGTRRRIPPIWARRAAIAAFVILAGWLAYPYVLPLQSWTAATGELAPEIELSDGTMAFLNSNAVLEYPEDFRKRSRTVRLSGEAFFEVSRDTERPFAIETDLAEVTVLGTSFGVNVDRDEQTIFVRVTEGIVQLQPTGSKLSLVIKAGEAASYNENTGALQMLQDPALNELAWHTKTLTFVRTPVSQVIDDLSATFDVSIDLRQSGIADCTYTSPQPFKNASAEQVLEAMSIVFHMRVTSPEEGYYLVIGGSCR